MNEEEQLQRLFDYYSENFVKPAIGIAIKAMRLETYSILHDVIKNLNDETKPQILSVLEDSIDRCRRDMEE